MLPAIIAFAYQAPLNFSDLPSESTDPTDNQENLRPECVISRARSAGMRYTYDEEDRARYTCRALTPDPAPPSLPLFTFPTPQPRAAK